MSNYQPDPMPIDPDMPQAMRAVWDELEQLRSSIRTKADKPVVEPAHGGIVAETPTGISDIGVAFQILPFDAAMLTLPVFVDQDFANDGLRLERAGIYSLNYGAAMSHNESNAGREMQFQPHFDGSPVGSPVTVAVGRNTPGTNITFGSLIEVSNAAVGGLLDIRVRSVADSFTTVVVEDQSFFVFSVSVKFEL